MKKFMLIFTLSFSLISCGQKVNERIEETVTDGNGKVISKEIIDSKKVSKITLEKTIDLFYKNQNDINIIDPLMSFRFYQTTPYNKFKELLIDKNRLSGNFIEKTLISSEKSDNGNAIGFTYKVKYQNLETVENIGLIRETKSDDYQIYIYNIKRAEK